MRSNKGESYSLAEGEAGYDAYEAELATNVHERMATKGVRERRSWTARGGTGGGRGGTLWTS